MWGNILGTSARVPSQGYQNHSKPIENGLKAATHQEPTIRQTTNNVLNKCQDHYSKNNQTACFLNA